MKNLHFMKKDIFLNNANLTQKNQYPDKIVELTTSSGNMFITNFNLSNLHINRKNKSFFPIGINNNTNKTFRQNFKLFPVHKIKLFENKELENITFDIIDVNNNTNNSKKFKRTVNQSSQSEFFNNNDDLDSKIAKKHYFKINELLNKKVAIRINNPKLRKINFKMNPEKNTFLENLLKSTNNKTYRKQINIKLKPLKYYTKSLNNNGTDEIISNDFNFKTRNNSPVFHKIDTFEKNNTYEVIKSFDKRHKIIYANKIIINDNDFINKNNEINDLYIKKRNDKKISSYDELLHLREKYKNNSNRNRRVKKIKFISYDDVKKLSKRGFDKMMSRKFKNYKNKLYIAEEKAEKFKKQFLNFMDNKRQMYEKNKDEILNDDVIHDK